MGLDDAVAALAATEEFAWVEGIAVDVAREVIGTGGGWVRDNVVTQLPHIPGLNAVFDAMTDAGLGFEEAEEAALYLNDAIDNPDMLIQDVVNEVNQCSLDFWSALSCTNGVIATIDNTLYLMHYHADIIGDDDYMNAA